MRPHEKNELPTTRITSYGQDHIVINNQTYLASIILFPNHLEERWGVSSARDLTAADYCVDDSEEVGRFLDKLFHLAAIT